MKKYISIFIVAVLLIIAFLFNSQAQHNKLKKPGDFVIKKATYQTAYKHKIEAESGWLAVAENRTKANNKIIKLPFYRFKSRSDNPGSPVIYLSGGPGDSGITEGKGQLHWVLDALRENADVIIFDQRGTGMAKPSLVMKGNFNLPLDQPLDSKASDEALRKTVESMAEFLKKQKIDPSAYNTMENANDIKELIEALNYQKANILSFSYGTHLSLALMKYHPQVVDKAVMISPNGLDQRWRSPKNIEAQFESIQKLIDSDSLLLAAYPQFMEDVHSVFQSLKNKPMSTEIDWEGKKEKVVIGKMDMAVIHALSMGNTENMTRIGLSYQGILNGNFSAIGEALVETLKRRPIGNVMTYLMSSASGQSDTRKAQIEADLQETEFGDAMNYPFNRLDFQKALGSTPLGNDFRSTFTSEIPTLIISGESDVRTSVEDAKKIKEQFVNVNHQIIPLSSHSVLYYSTGVIEGISSFFNDGTYPDPFKRNRPFELQTPKTSVLIKTVLQTIENQDVSAGITILRDWYDNKKEIVDAYLINGVASELLKDDQYEKAWSIYEVGMEFLPKIWYIKANASISLSRIGSQGVSFRSPEATERKKKAYRLYLDSKQMNPFYFSQELEDLVKFK